MKKLIFILLWSVFVISCSSKSEENSQKIIGEWIFEVEKNQNKDIFPLERDPQIIIFEKDGTFINKNGFVKLAEYDKSDKDQTIYLGEKTQYKINNDSLSILNPIENKFESVKIVQISKSKIVFQYRDKSLHTLIPFRSKKYENPPIDKIVVSKSACFGTCPINSSVVDKNGNLFFYGEAYNSKDGFYKNMVSNQKLQDIFNDLQYVDVKTLKSGYTVYTTDLPSESITFISDGKIIKTVYNYGDKAPFELRRLIRNISYLYQNIPLQPLKIKDPVLLSGLKSKTKRVFLKNRSDSFYLFTELLKAKPVTNSTRQLQFTGDYRIEVPEDYDFEKLYLYERSVISDGRFFKIQSSDQSFKTLDLGYNFFEKNHLIRFINDSIRKTY